MSSCNLRQYIQRVAQFAKVLMAKYSKELIVYCDQKEPHERLWASLKSYGQKAKRFWTRSGETGLLYVKRGTPFEHFRSVCIALIVCGVIALMSNTLFGKQRDALGIGVSPGFFPEAQTNFLNKWAAFEEKKLRFEDKKLRVPQTRRGEAERTEFYQEYEKMRAGSEVAVGWRCYITFPQMVDNRGFLNAQDGFSCSFSNRKSHCSYPGSPCLYRMTYAPNVPGGKSFPIGPERLYLRPPFRRHPNGLNAGFRPGDVGLDTNKLYVGDVVEFDGKIRNASFTSTFPQFDVDVSRIVVIAKETFTIEEYDDVK